MSFSSQAFTVQVPATSANMGPGFDSFGMALSCVNRFHVSCAEADQHFWLPESSFLPGQMDLSPQKSLFFRAMQALYDHQQQQRPAFKVGIEAHIPLARGLGSSSSVIVGGLLAAATYLNLLTPDSPLPSDLKQTLMRLSTRLEGHPDNVIPALLGGVGFCDEPPPGSVRYYPLSWPDRWQIMLVIPDSPLLTETARQVLPTQLGYNDAIFNLRKASLLTWALQHADATAMRDALDDRLHQPYRSPLIPLFKPVQNAAKAANAIGSVISGAGPSIAVFYEVKTQPAVMRVLEACLAEHPEYPATLCSMTISEQGAFIY